MNPQQRGQLQAATGICQNTIGKWDRGEPVTVAMDIALTKAAKELGILGERKAIQEAEAT
jgi:hypothetical protein